MKNYEKLLDIVKSEADLEEYLASRQSNSDANGADANDASQPSYEELYHLSKIRQNLLDWYEFDGDAKLLEIGAECGALTGMFAKKVAQVVAFDEDEDKCIVNRARLSGNEAVTVVSSAEYVDRPDLAASDAKSEDDAKIDDAKGANSGKSDGKKKDAASKIKSAITKTKKAISKKPEKYDYVTIVGKFTDEKLDMAVDHLASKGKIIIAVDNKFGLKNWTTAARPNLATKDEIVEKAMEKKLKLTSTYYPVPDFTFPLEVYSEYNLPKEGAIRTAAPEFEQDKTLLMDEPTAFSEMIREGRFDEYANSYILIFEKKGGRK